MPTTYGFCLGEILYHDSSQFSEVFHSLVGDGICPFGGRFETTPQNTMSLTVNTGFALVAGRWLKVSEPTTITLSPANNHYDRYDAVVIRVDLKSREVKLLGIEGKPLAAPIKYQPIRGGDIYEIVLYNVFVGMGVTSIGSNNLEDVRRNTSLCGYIITLQDIASSVLKAYNYLVGEGIEDKVFEIEQRAQQIILNAQSSLNNFKDQGDQTIENIINLAKDAGVSTPSVGDVSILYHPPTPTQAWLQCNGQATPPDYQELSTLLGGTLPDITPSDPRFKAWIYAGLPTT